MGVSVSRLVVYDLCDPRDFSSPGSPVRGLLQARILVWVDIPFSRVSFRPRVRTQLSLVVDKFFLYCLSYQRGPELGPCRPFSGSFVSGEETQVSTVWGGQCFPESRNESILKQQKIFWGAESRKKWYDWKR